MRQLISIAVALLTFLVGVTVSAFFAAVFGLGASGGPSAPSYAPPQTYSCPSKRYSRRAPEPPPPPAPLPADKSTVQTRVVVRDADGTVRVIESRAGAERR